MIKLDVQNKKKILTYKYLISYVLINFLNVCNNV